MKKQEDPGGPRVVLVRLPSEEATLARFSEAEQEVARRVCAGLSNAEIAAARGTSVRTVANQLASLLKRAGVESRVELARWALRGT